MKQFWILIILALFISLAIAENGDPRGYVARACGFDLDDDGIVGEASDDCTICDGDTGDGTFTVDPDGDSTEEDINFVDSATGTDDTTCGWPGDLGDGGPTEHPCATVQWVLDGSNTAYTKKFDGPGDGAEDIMCVAGSFTDITMTLSQSGRTTTHTARNSHEYPADPTMIIGWDQDGDGSYPPFDTDDTALFTRTTGSPGGFITTGISYIEIAHLKYVDYGGTQWAGRGENVNHHYLHDIELVDYNRGRTFSSSTRIFGGFNDNLDWMAIENFSTTNQNAWFWRGGSDDSNNWRFSEVTVTFFGSATAGVGIVKWWGTNNFNTIENSIFDSQAGLWRVLGTSTGLSVPQCSQDWIIRNNKFDEWFHSISLQPAASGFCDTREIKNVLIDGNLITTDFAPFSSGSGMRILNRQNGPTATFIGENIKIVNNFFFNTVNQAHGINDENSRTGAASVGDITIAGNTFHGTYTGNVIDVDADINPIDDYTIKNNIFSANTGNDIAIQHAPSIIDFDGNVFSGSSWHWNGTTTGSFDTWKTLTGEDANSTVCDPTYVDVATGDLHLDPSDTCATDAGVDITAITTVDIDGDTRLSVNADAGADEGGTTISLTGTLSPSGGTEAEIVAGGETLIFTLSGPPADTFDSTLGADNSVTTDFLNGCTSDKSEADGWNDEVKPSGTGSNRLNFNDLTRDSNTQATIVISAVTDYDITVNETITCTVPDTALDGSHPGGIVTEPATVVVQSAGGTAVSFISGGFVTAILDSTSHLPVAIDVGSSVTVNFTYDTAATDRAGGTWGEYLYQTVPSSLSLCVETHCWTNDTNFQMYVRVKDDAGGDQLIIAARGLDFPTGVTASSTNSQSSLLQFVLMDTDGGAIASTSPPSSFTLGDWEFASMEIVAAVPGGYYYL